MREGVWKNGIFLSTNVSTNIDAEPEVIDLSMSPKEPESTSIASGGMMAKRVAMEDKTKGDLKLDDRVLLHDTRIGIIRAVFEIHYLIKLEGEETMIIVTRDEIRKCLVDKNDKNEINYEDPLLNKFHQLKYMGTRVEVIGGEHHGVVGAVYQNKLTKLLLRIKVDGDGDTKSVAVHVKDLTKLEDNEFKVERIVREEMNINGHYVYLVKWTGFDKPTWEPEASFDFGEEIHPILRDWIKNRKARKLRRAIERAHKRCIRLHEHVRKTKREVRKSQREVIGYDERQRRSNLRAAQMETKRIYDHLVKSDGGLGWTSIPGLKELHEKAHPFKVGDKIDCKDDNNNWNRAVVVDIKSDPEHAIRVKFIGQRCNQSVLCRSESERIAEFGSKPICKNMIIKEIPPRSYHKGFPSIVGCTCKPTKVKTTHKKQKTSPPGACLNRAGKVVIVRGKK